MGKITFIIGGARSGKSKFATDTAVNSNGSVAYVATSPYYDENMTARIEQHKKDRPAEWPTFEEQKELPELLQSIDGQFDTILIDCLTLFVSNFILNNEKEAAVKEKTALMLEVLKEVNYHTLIISNEVGLGIHPENEMARYFTDVAGRINQMVAAKADEVFLVVAGIPVKIKG